jgi:4-amino-4-deoxy-L-arabinose transferase-like glycosyltransferase
LLLKLVPLAFGIVWFWLAYRLISLEASRRAAAICAALTAAVLWSVYLSTALLSETMFAALCTASLLYLRRSEIDETEGREWIIAAVLAGLAFLTRTAGVCMIATGVVFFLMQRRRRRAVTFLAIALAVCAPWLWWVATQHPPPTDAYYTASNYGSWNVLSSHFPLDRKMAIVFLNSLLLLRSPLSILGLRWSGFLDVLVSIALLVAACAGCEN